MVSYHEVGHALISALQKNSEPIQKITIVPRTMGALGYVMNVPEEEKYLETKDELHDRLVQLLGGRAAEEIVFKDVTTGAANDIEKATSIAQNMVTRFGMSDRFGMIGLATVESQYLDGSTRYNCSDRTVADIDSEVMKILKDCYEEAKRLLSENRDVMDKLAGHLIEKETISGKEFMKIYREIKGIPEPIEEDKTETEKKVQEIKEEVSELKSGQTIDLMAGVDVVVDDETKASTDDDASDDRWMPPTPGPENPEESQNRGRFSGAKID